MHTLAPRDYCTVHYVDVTATNLWTTEIGNYWEDITRTIIFYTNEALSHCIVRLGHR